MIVVLGKGLGVRMGNVIGEREGLGQNNKSGPYTGKSKDLRCRGERDTVFLAVEMSIVG